jgi:hypothetical protein
MNDETAAWPEGQKYAAPVKRPALERRGKPLGLTVGESAMLDRLWDEGHDIARLERALSAARKRRELLVHKAIQRGFTTREIGRIGLLTSAAVSQMRRRGWSRNGI